MWNLTKTDFFRKNKPGQSIPMSVKHNGVMSKSNYEVADFFSKHFNSVVSSSNINYLPELNQSLVHDLPRSYFFDLSHIENWLARLKGKKSVGPDGIFD